MFPGRKEMTYNSENKLYFYDALQCSSLVCLYEIAPTFQRLVAGHISFLPQSMHIDFLFFACWVFLYAFLSSVDFFFFNISKKSFRNTISIKHLVPDQARRLSWSGSKLFTKVISRQQKSPSVGNRYAFFLCLLSTPLFVDGVMKSYRKCLWYHTKASY